MMTATVSSAYTTPTGNVTFYWPGNVLLATVPVGSSGAASDTVSTLIGGKYTITAVYGGSTEYAGSTSNAITETVLGTDTSTSLSASPNPAAPGQSITFTAIVSGTQSAGPLTGTVTFKDGATTLGTGSVGTNGVAILRISSLLTGTHIITAAYGGSPEYSRSASAAISVVVTAIPTSIDLSASPNPAVAGQSVSLVATATSAIPGQVPTGGVTFSDQFSILGTVPLASGVAIFSTTALSAGTNMITADLESQRLLRNKHVGASHGGCHRLQLCAYGWSHIVDHPERRLSNPRGQHHPKRRFLPCRQSRMLVAARARTVQLQSGDQ